MKRIITFLLFTLSVYSTFSQDVVTYKNGKTQKVIVLTTNEKDITCQDFQSKEQFTISRSFIESVSYPLFEMFRRASRSIDKKDFNPHYWWDCGGV